MRPLTSSVKERTAPTPKTATPAKSILRPSTNHVRRKSEHVDQNGDAITSKTSTKRRKVLFSDTDNEVRAIGVRSLADVKAEIRKTLDLHSLGHDEDYDQLKGYFDQRTMDPSDSDDSTRLQPYEMTQYLLALASCAPVLKQKAHKGLAVAVLHCSWIGRDEAFVEAYIDFLAALATVQGTYLTDILDMLVELFSSCSRRRWTVSGCPAIDHDTFQHRLHRAIQRILRIFPAASRVLSGIVTTKFPSLDESSKTHLAYVKNMLKIRDYAPELGSEMLDLIVKQLVRIDVEMQTDLDDLDDSLATAVHRTLAQIRTGGTSVEAEAEDSDNESVDSDDSECDPEIAKIKIVTSQVKKLDATMDALFDFYSSYFTNPHSDVAISHHKILLAEFRNIILQTRKSRHTQFLLFHFVQSSDQLMEEFVNTCEGIAFRSNLPTVLRDYATCYLASFLARGARLPPEMIQGVFSRLLRYLERFRRSYESTCQGPDLKRYYSYYALCQAIFYIFCFRWRDLVLAVPDIVDIEDPLSYIGQDLDWGRGTRAILRSNIFGRMNPLKVCAPGIVEEFAKLAHKLNLIYVYPLMETNKRIRLSQYVTDTYSAGGALRDTGSMALLDESLLQMDPYFPFDPYQLPSSKRWIEGDYISWSPIAGLNADEDDEDESEADEDMGEQAVDEDTETGSEVEAD